MADAGALYRFLESAAPWFVAWSAMATAVTIVRVVSRMRRGVAKVPDSTLWTELAGLPLTLFQSVAFVWALAAGDWLSALLFAWWGPGFVITVIVVVRSKMQRRPIDWLPWRVAISYACKLTYLAYIAVFLWRGMPGMVVAFSAWIINDQIEKAWMSLDAVRLRRTFDDRWLFRVLYPLGLLTPLLYPEMAWRLPLLAYAAVLLALWLAGIVYVARRGQFFVRPEDPGLLRNMMYFARLR